MLNALIAVFIAVVLLGIFILSYKLNKSMPKPDNCEEIDESCINCSNPLCRNRVEKESDKENY